jgi:hypothetical protein
MIEPAKIKNSAREIKDLSNAAREFIEDLYGKQQQFQIEEVSRDSKGKGWVVTVSYFRKHESPNDLQKLLGLYGSRVYKQLTILPDGTVTGIKNWQPETATA